ncbi:hypothetical protein [Kutzneria kofuensis]|uniref:hypothetical protein n=1 Tax=Kutzneria kofuensis TaxID=103725 RepID=UPI0031EEB19A
MQVSIDDGSGKPPHTYTIDYNDAAGPTASPAGTHPAGAEPGQPGVGSEFGGSGHAGVGTQPTPGQPIGTATGAHAIDEPLAADTGQPLAHDASPLGGDTTGTETSGWTMPGETPVSTGPAHALPDDVPPPMPEPAAWTAPAAADPGFDFAPSGQHDQGSFSGSLFDAPAATTVAAASFTSGASVDTGGTSAWTLGGDTGHGMVGDQGGMHHSSAWDTAHSAAAPGMGGQTPTDQASAPGEAGLAQVGGAHAGASAQGGSPMGGMPMMGAMGGGGHAGAEDQERSTNASWRTPSAVFDDAGAASVGRMNGVLGEDEGSQRQ